MVELGIVASVTDPGHSDRENEDRLGWNDTAAFVVDGATGLGAPVVASPRSDAAWLAEHAATFLQAGLTTGRATAEVVQELNAAAAMRFAEARADGNVERYRYPTASFQVIRTTERGLELAGLGDCVLFFRDEQGRAIRWSPLEVKRTREQYFARKALVQNGGFDQDGVAYQERHVLSDLRSRRARHNVEGGNVWTLGLEPMAARHLVSTELALSTRASAVLCTDGFGDLVDNYARYTIEGLIEAAETRGLESLVDELRFVERELDPDGSTYPRYKRSDDASAIFLELIP